MSDKRHSRSYFGAMMSDHEYEEECKNIERRSKGFIARTVFALVISVCIGLFAVLSFFGIDGNKNEEESTSGYREEILNSSHKNSFDLNVNEVSIPSMGIHGKYVDEATAAKYNIPLGLNVVYITVNSHNTELKPGDIITSIHGVDIGSSEDLSVAFENTDHLSIISVKVFREGESIDLSVVIN